MCICIYLAAEKIGERSAPATVTKGFFSDGITKEQNLLSQDHLPRFFFINFFFNLLSVFLRKSETV